MKQSRKEIQKLILMLGGVIFAAFVVVAALVYSHSSSKNQDLASCETTSQKKLKIFDHSASEEETFNR